MASLADFLACGLATQSGNQCGLVRRYGAGLLGRTQRRAAPRKHSVFNPSMPICTSPSSSLVIPALQVCAIHRLARSPHTTRDRSHGGEGRHRHCKAWDQVDHLVNLRAGLTADVRML
ncbi:hypothetical protein LX32DRAFT_641138 [Colletotrichum zoysiae]|uniref:Uncharacterized protein n=1 Tax=Colletotrichum zoysiae TaxID=1216348 RepID=A0AAD9HFW6_9PEZI|nr:hypothetical protein LX32DRAFT_641138 [Colletotrichum zoysiae]